MSSACMASTGTLIVETLYFSEITAFPHCPILSSRADSGNCYFSTVANSTESQWFRYIKCFAIQSGP